jgi:hypothetical protein
LRENCTSLHRYKVIWNESRQSVYIQIEIKGSHTDDFRNYEVRLGDLPLTISYKWLTFIHKEIYNSNIDKFRVESKRLRNGNFLLDKCMQQTRKQIYNQRLRHKTKNSSDYVSGFNRLIEKLTAGYWPRFKLFKNNLKEMWVFVIIRHKNGRFPPFIYTIYFDGTFKAQFYGGFHYNIYFFLHWQEMVE